MSWMSTFTDWAPSTFNSISVLSPALLYSFVKEIARIEPITLPAGRREAWVRSACADERIAAEVLALLETYEQDPAFLEFGHVEPRFGLLI